MGWVLNQNPEAIVALTGQLLINPMASSSKSILDETDLNALGSASVILTSNLGRLPSATELPFKTLSRLSRAVLALCNKLGKKQIVRWLNLSRMKNDLHWSQRNSRQVQYGPVASP